MKKTLLAAILSLAAGHLFAQNELSNFTATGRGGVVNTFATDYQAIGINPANLGRFTNPFFSFSIGETGMGAGSKSLTHDELNKFIYHGSDKLTQAEKQEFAAAFNNDDALNVNIDFTSLALSVRFPKAGGLAFSNRLRVTGHMGLNKNGAEILFLGKDAPVFANFQPGDKVSIKETLAPTSVQMSILNEWNVAYGLQVVNLPNFKMQVGAGYKYVQGVGTVDIVVNDKEVTAFSALSPKFDVHYGDLVNNPEFNTSDIGGGIFKPVGQGHAFDLGVAAEFGDMVKAAVSVTDIGSMTWRGHLLTANDQTIQKVTSTGVNSFDFFSEVVDFAASGEDTLFTYEPGGEKKRDLPTKLRTGLGFKLSKKVDTGVDVTLPLNEVAGNLSDTFVGIGIDFKPVPVLRLSSGFSTGAGYGGSLPLGATFVMPHYEFGIATRDILGLFSDKNPYLSVAFGFLRFKFGVAEEE
jgi:hypothetical protein